MRGFLTLLAVAASLSCGGESSTSPSNEPVPGTYTLRTVNRIGLPYVIADQDSIISQSLDGEATATAIQDAAIDQAEG